MPIDSIGETIRNLRKSKGYSQQQLANKLKITQGAVSQWESGVTQPAADQLAMLANVFEMTVDELLGRRPDRPAETDESITVLTRGMQDMSPEERKRVLELVKVAFPGRFNQ